MAHHLTLGQNGRTYPIIEEALEVESQPVGEYHWSHNPQLVLLLTRCANIVVYVKKEFGLSGQRDLADTMAVLEILHAVFLSRLQAGQSPADIAITSEDEATCNYRASLPVPFQVLVDLMRAEFKKA